MGHSEVSNYFSEAEVVVDEGCQKPNSKTRPKPAESMRHFYDENVGQRGSRSHEALRQ